MLIWECLASPCNSLVSLDYVSHNANAVAHRLAHMSSTLSAH